jgi:recombination protein RecA
MSTLNEVLKDISKKFGDNVVKIGVEDLTVDGVLSLGSPSADFSLYGGIPEGRITEFSGAEGSGKTTTAFICAGQYQKKEIERNPENPRAIVFLDNEGTADPVWAKTLGYDMSEDAKVPTICLRPEAQSAEDILDMAINMLKTGEVGLLIFDSIATLVPQQIINESQEKQQMGGNAKALTRFANTAIGLLRKYKATLIAINQVRENISGYGDPLITPGGRSWKHACSSRIMFKRGAFFDEDGNELQKKNAQSPAGHIVEMYVLKTKTCKWDRKLAYYHLNYTKGVDIVADTIDVAMHFGYVQNPAQGTFTLVNPDTGETMVDESGKDIKIRGRKNLTDFFRQDLKTWKKVYDLCEDKLKQKDDPYIKSFEEMLNINLNEKIGIDLSVSEEI